MPHHAAVLKDILNIPTISPVDDPCAEVNTRLARDRQGHSLSEKAFGRIIAWMRSHIDEHISEDMLCALSPMGMLAFRRAFEAHAGLPPMHFLTWMRVDTAVRLLIDTRFDLTEIAFVTGFKTEQGLVSAFLATLGVRPQALRVSLG